MINKVTLLGNLGADPEVRYLPNGDAVANFTLATSRTWKKKDTGEKVVDTEWHRVIMFRRLAEIAGEYLKKGSQIYIEGRLKTRQWDKEGVKHYTTEIIAEELHMLGGKNNDNTSRPASQSSNRQANSKPQSAPETQRYRDDQADFDDDIPF